MDTSLWGTPHRMTNLMLPLLTTIYYTHHMSLKVLLSLSSRWWPHLQQVNCTTMPSTTHTVMNKSTSRHHNTLICVSLLRRHLSVYPSVPSQNGFSQALNAVEYFVRVPGWLNMKIVQGGVRTNHGKTASAAKTNLLVSGVKTPW